MSGECSQKSQKFQGIVIFGMDKRLTNDLDTTIISRETINMNDRESSRRKRSVICMRNASLACSIFSSGIFFATFVIPEFHFVWLIILTTLVSCPLLFLSAQIPKILLVPIFERMSFIKRGIPKSKIWISVALWINFAVWLMMQPHSPGPNYGPSYPEAHRALASACILLNFASYTFTFADYQFEDAPEKRVRFFWPGDK